MEVINLGVPEEVKISTFGPGIELLMNDKKKESSIKLSDLDKLENELNDLSKTTSPSFPRSEIKEDTIKFDTIRIEEPLKFDSVRIEEPKIRFDEPQTVKFDIPEKKESKTWDGFKPFQGDPDKVNVPKETLRERFSYLRKLEELELKGIRLTRKYTMDSSLDEMKGEYENIIAEKEKSNNVKFQGKMLMACITGLEFLNSKFDPFDVKLDGWAEQVNENISDYDEIFAELHEKYKTKASLAPELKLLFQLGGSAIMLHMTNTMFKSSIPGLDDIMKQNPDLMHKFTQAAVNSVGATHPGLSGFMNSVQPPREAREFSKREEHEEKRPDMKGPSDIQSILSGLKPKTIQLDQGSTVSLSELNEMKEGLSSAKRGRRKRSDKNTMNLDL
jgi:hypothetical protein